MKKRFFNFDFIKLYFHRPLIGEQQPEKPGRGNGRAVKSPVPILGSLFPSKLQQEVVALAEALQANDCFLPEVSSRELNLIASELKHLSSSLRHAQESFDRIFHTNIFPLILIAPYDFRIAQVNGSFLELIGFTKDQMIGSTLSELSIWSSPEQSNAVMQTLREKKQIFGLEVIIRTRTKERFTGSFSAEPLILNDTEYILASLKDLTGQKLIESKLQYSYNYLIEILEGIGDVFFTLDPAWHFTYINQRDPFFLNRTRADLLGKNIWELFPTLKDTVYYRECLRSMNEKTPTHFQAPSILGDQWYEMDIYPLKTGISVCGRNITSQQQLLDALKRSNQQIVDIMDGIPEAFFSLDTNWRFIYLNKQAGLHLKRSHEELIGKRIWAQIPEMAGSQMANQLHKAISEHTAVYYEGPSPLSDQVFEFHIYPTPEGLSIYMHDITEQKVIEQAQARAEERFSNILDNIGDPIFVLDHNWSILYVNRKMEHYLGLASEKLINQYIWDLQPDFRSTVLFERLKQVFEQQLPTRFEEYFAASNCWMDFNVFYSASGLIICLRDVTERKKAESELTQSHQRIATILESITDAFFCLDKNWRFTDLNTIAEATWQKEKAQLLGKTIWEQFPQLAGSQLEQEFYRAVYQNTAVHFEFFIPGIDTWVEIHAYPDENGLTVYSRDISIRKRQEISAATERELLLITLRSIGDGVIAANRDGQIILINKTAEELTGWSYDEALGLPLNKVFYVINDKTSEPYDNIVALTIQTGETGELPNAVLVNRQFREINIANSCAPIRSSNGEFLGVVMVFQDITEKLKTEAELLKAHKIESIGVLAGGIAHDFNNFLAAILANLQLTALRLDRGHDVKRSLNEAITATQKASELTKQLLTFSKGGAPVKKSVSIARLLEETTNFHLSGSKVKPIFCIPEDLWHVEVDAGQLSQVISNLVINAEQSMPKGGSIGICAENTILPENDRYKAGRYIKIAFKDNGSGIPEEHLGKIFDPFFTTKPSGSGLGLATSYSIIKKHGGYIDLTTKVGFGTTFFIYLPASETQPEIETPETVIPVTGEGKILVMDDEAMIRDVVSEMLSMLGYQATTARDGLEAIQLYQVALANRQPFVAVIMDLTIPGGMGGAEAIHQILALDPDAKVIVSSGYANDPVMADYAKYGFRGVIHKPYKIEDFSQTLTTVIHGAREKAGC